MTVAFSLATPLGTRKRARKRPAACPCAALSASARERAAHAARDFLTQRAAQTLMFTSRALRDETTALWLDRFFGGGQEDLHAADALRSASGARISSGPQLRALFRAPCETILVRKPVMGRGGATSRNPHIRARFVEYDVDIDPRALARRLLSVRRCVAGELRADLRAVGAESDAMWRAFRAAVAGGGRVAAAVGVADAVDLSLMDAGAFAGVEAAGGTPYRVANYDLALSMSLAIAAETVMERQGEDGWFGEFCGERMEEMLRPPRGIRRAAVGFLAALLSEAPVLREGGIARDPMLICEQLLKERIAVCEVWTSVCEKTDDEHLELERELLEESI